MIVESSDELEVPVVGVPIFVEVDHMGVDVVDTCMVFDHTSSCAIGSDGGSIGPLVRIETCGSSSSSVKGFSKEFVVDVCRSILVSSLSLFFSLGVA
jgi:hypothetical protein